MKPEVEGEVREPAEGSMSSEVRNEVSESPEAVEVRARKRSRRLFWSARRTPCESEVRRALCSKMGDDVP